MKSGTPLVFAEIKGDGIELRGAGGDLLAPPGRRPRQVVVSRADYELYIVAGMAGEAGRGSRRSVEEGVRSLRPDSLDGVAIDSKPPKAGVSARIVVLMKTETLAVYRRHIGGARLLLLPDLLRKSLPGLEDATVLHWTWGCVELLRFEARALAESLRVVPSGEESSGGAWEDALSRAVRLLSSTCRLLPAGNRLYLLASNREIASIAGRLALLLAEEGCDPAIRNGTGGRFIGAMATESLVTGGRPRAWFRRPTILQRIASSRVALLSLLFLCGAAAGALFLRAETLQKEAALHRAGRERERTATPRQPSIDSEISRLTEEQSRLIALRPANIYELLCELQQAFGPEVSLREITFSQGSFDLRATGPDALDAFRGLEASERIENLVLVEAHPSAGAGTEFRIRGRYP